MLAPAGVDTLPLDLPLQQPLHEDLNIRATQRIASMLNAVENGAKPSRPRARARVQSTSTELLSIDTFVSREEIAEGPASAIAVHSKFVAIGTTAGIVVIYDYFRAERAKIVPPLPKGSSERVPVSTLCMSEQHEWLMIGLADGVIQIWDWVKGELLHTAADVHSCTLVHAGFLEQVVMDKGQWLVTGDQNGAVNTLKVEKRWIGGYKHEKNVVVDGVNSGRVLSLAMMPELQDSVVMNSMAVMAVCTEDPDRVTELGAQTAIVHLLPTPRILRQAPRPNTVREGTVPYLAWLQGAKEHEDTDSMAYLAIGWGTTLDVVRLSCSIDAQMTFSLVARMQCGWHMCGVSFMSNDSLLIMGSQRQMRILGFRPVHQVDSRRLTEMDPMDIPVMVVKHPYYVSMYGEPQHSFHNSLGTSNHVLFLLGFDQVVTVKVLSWNSRVDALVASHRWTEALNLLLEFYEHSEGRSEGSIAGVMRNRPLCSEEIRAVAPDVFEAYLQAEETMRIASSTSKPEIELLIQESVHFCLRLHLIDFLCIDMMEHFAKLGHLALFLEVLEPFVLDNTLTSLPPNVMKAYVDEFTATCKMRRMELLLLNLSISEDELPALQDLSLIHISEPTRLLSISYAVFCLKKKKNIYSIT
eukprot:TRINITY_DN17835_c0_g1_i2.p1 TRINITY_DN17835_c0_g1~~TRINITY_DN17835_c0_g1_i2.p1  ORF type:complete len:638 (-),score=141.50 TRINITY_DN17835_c0_g1_i2:104-2017(-)